MGMIDIRSPIEMNLVSKLLLRIAQEPLQYVDTFVLDRSSVPGDEEAAAAKIARQASAAIISGCVVQLWSCTVCYLHALELDFPLYPKSVIRFIRESRLPFMSYISLYYSLCKRPFEGTATHEKAKTIVDMRHELEHDKPEETNEHSTERLNKVLKWKSRLEHLVGKEALLWLPRVRRSDEKLQFEIKGEPSIMKYMKYPVAKWALESTVEIHEDMRDMLFQYEGKKKIAGKLSIEEMVDERFRKDKDMLRLWQSGE
jgi:hypothetical protein